MIAIARSSAAAWDEQILETIHAMVGDWSRAKFVTGAPGGEHETPAIAGHTVPAWTGALMTGDADLEGAALVIDPRDRIPADVGPGSIVRFARPTGDWANDPGVGWFGRPERTLQDKNLPVWAPVGEAIVIDVQSDRLVLDRELTVPSGTRFFVGSVPALGGLGVDDTLPGVALAGAPGWVFGKVMQAGDGTLGVPFWRAVDIAADNRIPTSASTTTAHVFDASSVSGPITVTATLLYRRHAFGQAHLRGWQAVDVVRATTTIVAP